LNTSSDMASNRPLRPYRVRTAFVARKPISETKRVSRQRPEREEEECIAREVRATLVALFAPVNVVDGLARRGFAAPGQSPLAGPRFSLSL
jgi:hypothetical protein